MVNPRVWVSTTARDVDLGPAGPGAHWQEVGTINTTYEKALWNNVQIHLGLRRSAPRLDYFYVDGAASSSWVISARNQGVDASFWLAIDPYGDGSRYLVTIDRASLGTLARRPAPPHPSQIDRPVPVGVRVRSKEGCVFEAIGP